MGEVNYTKTDQRWRFDPRRRRDAKKPIQLSKKPVVNLDGVDYRLPATAQAAFAMCYCDQPRANATPLHLPHLAHVECFEVACSHCGDWLIMKPGKK